MFKSAGNTFRNMRHVSATSQEILRARFMYFSPLADLLLCLSLCACHLVMKKNIVGLVISNIYINIYICHDYLKIHPDIISSKHLLKSEFFCSL